MPVSFRILILLRPADRAYLVLGQCHGLGFMGGEAVDDGLGDEMVFDLVYRIVILALD